MEIYLLRHTLPEIGKGICYGQSDIPLADTFEAEVDIIRQKYPVLQNDFIVYSSPLLRCKLLASKLFDSNIIYDKRLLEFNFGDWELKVWDAIDQADLDTWMKDFVNVATPNGESYLHLQKRVLEFINEIQSSKKNILLITHHGVIRTLLANSRGIKLEDSFSIKAGYSELVKIEI